jgi:hypothetical protein
MPETIDYIEKNGKYDVLEIFRRGEVPSEPELIYGRLNKETEEKTKEVIKEKKFVTKNNQTYGYNTAKESISINSEDSDGYLFLGLAQCLNGNKKEGIPNLKKAKDMGNTQAETLIEKYK